MYFINFLLWKTSFIFVYVIIYYVGAGITTLMSISDGWDPYIFLSKDGKVAVPEGRNGRKGARVGISPLIYNMIKVLSLFVPWSGVQTIMFPANERYK